MSDDSIASDRADLWDAIAAAIDQFLHDLETKITTPCLSRYVENFSGNFRKKALVELAKVHIEHRYHVGDHPSISEYLERFPELTDDNYGPPADLVVEALQLAKKYADDSGVAQILAEYSTNVSLLKDLRGQDDHVESQARIGLLKPVLKFEPGQRLQDFEIVRLVGRGSFADVYLAYQPGMERVVALKISSDRGDEARTLARLDHPNIIRVYDLRVLDELHIRLLSMQFAPGGTLHSVIKELATYPLREIDGATLLNVIDGSLAAAAIPPPEESQTRSRFMCSTWIETVVEIGIQLSSALSYAHQRGILHRDIKPANVLLTAEAVCKLADFNIAFSADERNSSPCRYFGGSLAYMSPEQMLAAISSEEFSASDLDDRSDVFSLCCVLWELLTMKKCWPMDVMGQNYESSIRNLLSNRRQFAPQSNEDLEAYPEYNKLVSVLRSGLSFDREQRTRSAQQLVGQLRLTRLPQAWSIFYPDDSLFRQFASKYPWVCAGLVIFIPHVFAGIFNYQYNLIWLLEEHPDSYAHFRNISIVVNGLFFGGGGLLFAMLFRSVLDGVKHPNKVSSDESGVRLDRLFAFPLKVATVGLTLWLIAGVIFPMALSFQLADFGMTAAVHFFGSLAICGALVVVYPFWGTSLTMLEVWYGKLVGKELMDARFQKNANRILVFSDRIVVIAAGVPLLGIGMLLLLPAPGRFWLYLLVIIGCTGLALSYAIRHRIHRVVTLIRAVIGSDNLPV